MPKPKEPITPEDTLKLTPADEPTIKRVVAQIEKELSAAGDISTVNIQIDGSIRAAVAEEIVRRYAGAWVVTYRAVGKPGGKGAALAPFTTFTFKPKR